MPEQPHRPHEVAEEEQYLDRSFDHIAHVRAAKDAAQRNMEEFGDLSEYDVTILQVQLKEEPVRATQATLEFESHAARNVREGA